MAHQEMNPQRLAFKEYYCNPESETFGNAYKSAIKAGFSDEYAQVITAPSKEVEWVAEIVRDQKMLSKAEKVLDECLEMDTDNPIIVEGEIVDRKRDPQLHRIKQDTAKFVAARLGKHRWAERQELTGKNGERLFGLSKLFEEAEETK